jgi:hypothetical protein
MYNIKRNNQNTPNVQQWYNNKTHWDETQSQECKYHFPNINKSKQNAKSVGFESPLFFLKKNMSILRCKKKKKKKKLKRQAKGMFVVRKLLSSS